MNNKKRSKRFLRIKKHNDDKTIKLMSGQFISNTSVSDFDVCEDRLTSSLECRLHNNKKKRNYIHNKTIRSMKKYRRIGHGIPKVNYNVGIPLGITYVCNRDSSHICYSYKPMMNVQCKVPGCNGTYKPSLD